jgi:uncharacterized protein (DUF1501 family)
MSHIARGLSRRLFLRHAAATAALGSAAPLALNLSLMQAAAAQSAGDYKALVCVFLKGGNDAFNTVLATDAESWAAYEGTRGASSNSIALGRPGNAADETAAAGTSEFYGGVLPLGPINPQGRTFALHPAMSLVRPLFNNARRLSVVANVGPLIVPTGKADVERAGHPLPPKLQSHNDQESMWHGLGVEGASRGWGGRMGDLMASGNGQSQYTAITTAGRPLWASGLNTRSVAVSSAGAIPFGFDADGTLYGSAAVADAMKRIGAGTRGSNAMEADYADMAQRSIATAADLAVVLPPASDPRWAGGGAPGGGSSLSYVSPVTLQHATNPLAVQLQTVGRVMAAATEGAMAVRRQVFFVELSGFDTHSDQSADHAELLAQLAHGMYYFDRLLGNLGLSDSVTLFTASEFGRTFTHNGDGTDHGWGGHHFVLGPALAGGDIHGQFPRLGLKNATGNRFDSSPDQLNNGMLLPSLAVEQMAASLGRWFGLSDSALLEILPNLNRFSVGGSGGFIA